MLKACNHAVLIREAIGRERRRAVKKRKKKFYYIGFVEKRELFVCVGISYCLVSECDLKQFFLFKVPRN